MQTNSDISVGNNSIITPIAKPIIDLSYSSSNQINSCARKYQIRKRFNHSSSFSDDSLASMGGRAIHGYIQDYMSGLDQQTMDLNFFHNWDFNVEQEDSDWNRNTRGMEACLVSARSAISQLSLNASQIATININNNLQSAIEVKFNIILTNDKWKNDYHYRGSIDLITYSQLHGIYTVYDIKTHRDESKVPIDYKYKYDTQTIPYGLVISQITGQSIDNFQAHYMSLFVDVTNPRANIIQFTRTKKDVDYWFTSTVRQIEQIEQYSEDKVWPRSTTGCDAYRKPCAFFKYCDIEEPFALQMSLLKFGQPIVPKPFGEIITLNMRVD
jgi:PD-(D/E)XK nuclease superfamily